MPPAIDMRERIAAIVVVVVLGTATWFLPALRRALIFDITWWDAPTSDAPPLPTASGPGLSPTPRTRVVLIDGLSREVAPALPAWSALCERGLRMTVDVGFPTISLPVEVSLWTGLTQQQTGVVTRNGGRNGRYGRPLDPPLDRRGIPAQIPGSIAIAEHHGWIARSLGFTIVQPPAKPGEPTLDDQAEHWAEVWTHAAHQAVISSAPLVFVHVLRVDDAGHKFGLDHRYGVAAGEADAILARLVDADPGARWFVLSDHGHRPEGGHGGEERALRHVEGCIAGPGVIPGTAQLVHVIDVARAIADSTGATLAPASQSRPLSVAVGAPLEPDRAVPPLPLANGVIAIFLVAAALAVSAWGVRRWWLAPWWFVVACAALYLVRGEPTLSSSFIYKPEGRSMYVTWLPALALASVATWLALARMSLARVLVAQLAFPAGATAAVMAACGAWQAVLGAEQAPVVPRYTAWMLAVLLMFAHGAGAVAVGVLARLVLPRRPLTGDAPS